MPPSPTPPSSPSSSPSKKIFTLLENCIQRDEGSRGITDLLLPPGELQAAAKTLYERSNNGTIAILTGFPCMLDDPPTETDGPPGALAIARACIGLGGKRKCVVLTDKVNASVVEAAMKVHLETLPPALLSLESFPPLSEWGPMEEGRLQALAKEISVVVAIERTGPSASGHYYTMRGREMDAVVAPLERILVGMEGILLPSIGIGDGGNEVGMGKVKEAVMASSKIPNAKTIACSVATTHLIVASVSNWGGYALAAALAVLRAEADIQEGIGEDDTREAWIDRLLLTPEMEYGVLERMVAAGARDGVTGERQAWVDGMPVAKSIEVLEEIRRIATTNT